MPLLSCLPSIAFRDDRGRRSCLRSLESESASPPRLTSHVVHLARYAIATSSSPRCTELKKELPHAVPRRKTRPRERFIPHEAYAWGSDAWGPPKLGTNRTHSRK